jgi:hypothetical protein
LSNAYRNPACDVVVLLVAPSGRISPVARQIGANDRVAASNQKVTCRLFGGRIAELARVHDHPDRVVAEGGDSPQRIGVYAGAGSEPIVVAHLDRYCLGTPDTTLKGSAE